ncbi:MAG: hypothetical protein KDA62_16315, partial [Planctomycetales bacterium]|nr:hypothetical protein [Planctomycetales bacterium]
MSNRVYEIFEQVCDLPANEREAVIERLCGKEQGVRDEVESLLKAHDGAGQFLQQPTLNPPEIAETLIVESGIERPGTVVGL